MVEDRFHVHMKRKKKLDPTSHSAQKLIPAELSIDLTVRGKIIELLESNKGK